MKKFLMASVLLAAGFGNHALADESVKLLTDDGNVKLWRIDEPAVNQRSKSYPQITFDVGDQVFINAGGCVQTGGAGKTWKRYVSPSGPNSDHLYHGQIQIPGVINTLTNFSDLMSEDNAVPTWSRQFDVTQQVNDWPIRYLVLGYTDDDYSDNGYWGRDPGTENQCVNEPNAFVEIYIKKGH